MILILIPQKNQIRLCLYIWCEQQIGNAFRLFYVKAERSQLKVCRNMVLNALGTEFGPT